jgi:hypothetical protein
MEIRGKWIPFTATTVDQAQPFTFGWKARLNVLPGVWLIAEDRHDGEKGGGGAKLWGIISMGGRQDQEAFSMQLIRSLAELPWKPHFVLLIPTLRWSDTGDRTFSVQTAIGGQNVSVSFGLDSSGDVRRAYGKRHLDVPEGYVELPWHYCFSDHQEIGGVRLPTAAVATYEKPDGPWTYWRGRVTSVVPDA